MDRIIIRPDRTYRPGVVRWDRWKGQTKAGARHPSVGTDGIPWDSSTPSPGFSNILALNVCFCTWAASPSLAINPVWFSGSIAESVGRIGDLRGNSRVNRWE